MAEPDAELKLSNTGEATGVATGEATAQTQATVPDEPQDPIIELGDRIRLYGGKYDKTTGRVIYRTEEELHIIPDGLTNRVIEFNLTDEGFEETTGIESVEILQKRKKFDLVEILDLRSGQDLETFNSDGEPVSKYRIVSVNPEEDSIVVANESDGEVTIPFGFRGIPKSFPFRVARGRQAREILPPLPEEAEELEGEQEEQAEQVEEELAEGDFTYLDEELEAPADFGVEKLIEIPTSERTYSNQTQKSEAYADLLSLNTPARQRLVETQKATRVMTEIFFQLRASILRVSEDGTPKGVKPTSIQTLVDALETRLLALSRCVVDIDKIVYHDMNQEKDPQPEIMPGLRMQSLEGKILSANEYLESSPDIVSQKFPQFLNGYLTQFNASWRASGAHRIAFQRDEEVFRKKAPEPEADIPGFACCLPTNKHGNVSADLVSEVSMSLVRGLKALKVRSQIMQLGEEAAVLAYVLFPLTYASSLSTVSQESLISDIKDGQKNFQSLKAILAKTGEITDIPSASSPFLVSVDGGTLGNIPLRDYLKSAGLRAEGLGDIWPLQVLMGMRDREWTIDQQEVLSQIIKETQAQIINEIQAQRDRLAQQVSQPPAVQGILMVPDGPAMIDKLAEEPLLKDIQQSLKDQMPGFANSDVAMVGLLLNKHPDLAFAQLADQPAALTRNRMKYAREEYLKTLNEIQMKKQRLNFAGEPPEPVTCRHTKPLAMIRKVKDQPTRMALLAKLLVKFQGPKEDNWVKCNAGDHNLLCVHELLQIYQFLRPGDVAALNKEIQLKFGGGQFQGYYICRNCGQPIDEVEYDTHLEFDDNGRPMMGRSELVDKDAITLDEIDEVIGPIGKMDEPLEFDNETKGLIYTTAKEIADRLQAPLEMPDFMTIVNRVYGLIQQIPTRERYIQIQQAQKKGKATAVTAINADYDVYINQVLVCATAVHMLLLIQTRKPDLILRGVPTGCRNLGGQPLDADPKAGTSGIQCVVSVISSFHKDKAPWSLTQFQKEADDSVRQKTIMGIFEPILRASLQDPTILQALSQKRDYMRKVLGAAGGQGRPDEQLPTGFAPIPYVMKEEDFVEHVIIPEAASEKDRAELWIRQGNVIARKHKMPMPLAFSEASCCLSPLEKTDDFWHSDAIKQSLPPFSKRTGVPAPPRITRAEPTMIPSQISRPLPDQPEDSYYQLFLKVCYDGDQKGHSHEFGLTHICMWCGLTLPTELELLTKEQGLAVIEDQGIEVTKESFEDLLNETHRVNSFDANLKMEIPGPLDNWIALMSMEPEPAEGYKAVMAQTQVELAKLPVDAKEVEVAMALADFSSFADSLEAQFKARMPQSQHALIDAIERDGAESIIRFIHSYALVPLNQFVSRQSPRLQVPKSWDLSWQHQGDISDLLANHRGYLVKFSKISVTPWLQAKAETFIAQARAIIDKLEILRPLQVPGGQQTYGYFLKFCLYAPVANFVDPNTLPFATEAPASQVEQQALFPAKFISDMIARFKEEGFKLTPEQIRELIAKRNEMEKSNILKKMTEAPRASQDIIRLQMKLGIGDWAVGGTKAIYAYDQERYDIEREQRAEAGIIDFPGFGPEGPGGATDYMGMADGGDEEGYIGDEMLGEMNGFDDDN